MKHPLFAALIGLSGLLPLAAQAQLHEGDIEISVVNARLVLSGNDAFHFDGSAIFEGDFGDFAGGPYSTDDPGFDSAAGTFTPGALINYAALGSLRFWNGSQWTGAVPGQEYVRFNGNFGEDTRFGTGGVTGDLTGLIGQAGSGGDVHEHLDMSVARVLGGVPSVGAYLIQLQLTSPSYGSSAPYYMALNRGLSEAGFEAAVVALSAVPEPQTWLLLASGLAAVMWQRRRRDD